MASFYCGTVQEFLSEKVEHILARLAVGYANRGYTTQYSDQTLTWQRDLLHLRKSLEECVTKSDSARLWGLLLEFSIPRKELRIDIVLLIRRAVVVIEAKAGIAASDANRQVEEYAMLLHYFHKATSNSRVLPVVVSDDAAGVDNLSWSNPYPQMASYWVASAARTSWSQLAGLLRGVEEPGNEQISAHDWNDSPYFPVPSIIEAALSLRSGLAIREIAQSEASEHEIDNVRKSIQHYVNLAREGNKHVICFLTGVPGSGKTLVGLGLAHSEENKHTPIHFMSGNGPLVTVLQHLFTQESMRAGESATEARSRARTLIENVHVFARYHMADNQDAPSNHAIIFDEAQRAWNQAQNLKKFKRDYSEPDMLLGIMERHRDWATVVALVGGGQEINDGEAGLEEWGRALAKSKREWVIYASPEVLEGGPSTAGHRLFDDLTNKRHVTTNPTLHLRTSNRSLRAERLATWVNEVIEGNADKAASLDVTTRFPIFLSRDLQQTRLKLRQQRIGNTRYGLVGSSGAMRLRAAGLEPSSSFHADYQWEHWYLSDETDVRSSYKCEVFATEFEIQGLELDWIGICWGGDFVWNDSTGWQLRILRPTAPSGWRMIKRAEKQVYRRNAYRVLLTRARQGMIIYVPKGDEDDPTIRPEEFDATARYLTRCGVTPLSSD
jgi:Uncharacterized conserved protein (DUF2075)